MTRMTMVALALAAYASLAGLALADGCREEAKMSCAEGSVWNEETRSCMPKPSS